MKKYKVYFEIYGKKWVTTVEAKHEIHAKGKIFDKIKFHLIEEKAPKAPPSNPFEEIFGGIFRKH
jgi:hypothetical protein